MQETQNEPDHCLHEPIDSRKARKATASIVYRHVNDESN